MILIVGGFGNTSSYFNPFVKCLSEKNEDIGIHLLDPRMSLNEHKEALSYKVNTTKSFIHLIAFSMGSLILVDTIPLFTHNKYKITLINPCNLFADVGLDHSNHFGSKYNHYKSLCENKKISNSYNLKDLLWKMHIIFFLKRFFKTIMTYIYMFSIGKTLDEPKSLINDLLNNNLNDLTRFVENCGFSLNWYQSLKYVKYSNVKKINIICGNKDRYLSFCKLLSNNYSNIFSLKIVDGHHHIMNKNPYEVMMRIY